MLDKSGCMCNHQRHGPRTSSMGSRLHRRRGVLPPPQRQVRVPRRHPDRAELTRATARPLRREHHRDQATPPTEGHVAVEHPRVREGAVRGRLDLALAHRQTSSGRTGTDRRQVPPTSAQEIEHMQTAGLRSPDLQRLPLWHPLRGTPSGPRVALYRRGLRSRSHRPWLVPQALLQDAVDSYATPPSRSNALSPRP